MLHRWGNSQLVVTNLRGRVSKLIPRLSKSSHDRSPQILLIVAQDRNKISQTQRTNSNLNSKQVPKAQLEHSNFPRDPVALRFGWQQISLHKAAAQRLPVPIFRSLAGLLQAWMNKRAINNTNGSRTCLVFPWVFHMSAILQHQWHFRIWVFPKSTNEIDLPKLQSDPSMVDDRHQKRRTPSKVPSPTELKNRTQCTERRFFPDR